MSKAHFAMLAALVAICGGQRSPYSGRRPIGYPVIVTTTSANKQNDTLGNRFGDGQTTTTQRLPVEALGDRELFNRLGKLPQEQQPFWFINWQALEANRNSPQSYPLRPNIFIEDASFRSNDVQEPEQSSTNKEQPSVNNQGFINSKQPSLNNENLTNTST